MFLQAICRRDGVLTSTVEVDDAVWANFASDIRAAMLAREFDAVPTEDVGPHELERHVGTLPEAHNWIATLFADAD